MFEIRSSKIGQERGEFAMGGGQKARGTLFRVVAVAGLGREQRTAGMRSNEHQSLRLPTVLLLRQAVVGWFQTSPSTLRSSFVWWVCRCGGQKVLCSVPLFFFFSSCLLFGGRGGGFATESEDLWRESACTSVKFVRSERPGIYDMSIDLGKTKRLPLPGRGRAGSKNSLGRARL